MVFPVVKITVVGFPVDRVDFPNFPMNEFIFSAFSVNLVQFRGFFSSEIRFDAFSSIELIPIGFRSTSLFFMELILRLPCFHGFLFTFRGGYPIDEKDFHELPMEENGSLGFHIDEVSFHSPKMMKQTSTNSSLPKSIQLISNRWNSFP